MLGFVNINCGEHNRHSSFAAHFVSFFVKRMREEDNQSALKGNKQHSIKLMFWA